MDLGPGKPLLRTKKSPIALTRPVAPVEQQGLAVFQGSVAAIRLTQEALAHLKELGREAECFQTAVAAGTACPEAVRADKLAALAESLNDYADAVAEHIVLRPLALAADTLARKAVPPVQGTGSPTYQHCLFEEHCQCRDTQSPSS